MIEIMQLLLLLMILSLLWLQHTDNSISQRKQRARIILDTCALIDGRIIELAKAGFVPKELIIPEFIVHELQLLADGSDAYKRSRARYGLDAVRELQAISNLKVLIDKAAFPDIHAVDNKLVALAKKRQASLYTTDYNLGKVAEIENITVLNVNELAQYLRPSALPGEQKMVKIIQKGSSAKQGAGYLEDGTLIVVENAAQHVGKTVQVEITKTHQTASGKMLFGELRSPSTPRKSARTSTVKRSSSAQLLASRLKH